MYSFQAVNESFSHTKFFHQHLLSGGILPKSADTNLTNLHRTPLPLSVVSSTMLPRELACLRKMRTLLGQLTVEIISLYQRASFGRGRRNQSSQDLTLHLRMI